MVKPSLCQPSDSFFRYKCVLLLYRKQNSKKNVLNGPNSPNRLKIEPLLPDHIQLSCHYCTKGCISDLNRVCVCVCVCMCLKRVHKWLKPCASVCVCLKRVHKWFKPCARVCVCVGGSGLWGRHLSWELTIANPKYSRRKLAHKDGRSKLSPLPTGSVSVHLKLDFCHL